MIERRAHGILTFLLCMTALTGVSLAHGQDPNLQGWWKFDGDALDSSGHGRNGMLVGDATFAAGLSGQALSLDGSGDYVTISVPIYGIRILPPETGASGIDPVSVSAIAE